MLLVFCYSRSSRRIVEFFSLLFGLVLVSPSLNIHFANKFNRNSYKQAKFTFILLFRLVRLSLFSLSLSRSALILLFLFFSFAKILKINMYCGFYVCEHKHTHTLTNKIEYIETNSHSRSARYRCVAACVSSNSMQPKANGMTTRTHPNHIRRNQSIPMMTTIKLNVMKAKYTLWNMNAEK